ncbi:AAA family ATPase [Sulfuritalea hydrogenivorans]|uniref:Uncharacterized protein n=1 Tax=Sulfuritalea hydrogenivorans sk43H TaxID=1223802 RepID=W0SFJ5_9PROT|nr:AAA family ATPase [Sulfuritalea hydrogenivorans]BAO30034.1 hypothetical protein SUTH_02244 [Sulfuritalea hydrogenivorans sk43H]
MNEISAEIRVASIRSRGRCGGAIFAGSTDAGERYVVVADYQLIPDGHLVDRGQQWLIEGTTSVREVIAPNGFKINETQIAARKAELIRPAGRNVINWISTNPECVGIGHVKAAKLYQRFGSELVDVVKDRDIPALCEILNEQSADMLCRAFEKFNVASTLLWLDRLGIPQKIGASVIAFYQDQAQAKIEANPYALISFEARWLTVDDIARKRFGIQADDPRRLASAIEEALYRGLSQGHTCLPSRDARAIVVRLLDSPELATKAIEQSRSNSQYQVVDDLYQATGAHFIERYVAERLRAMIRGENGAGQAGLFTQLDSNPASLEDVLSGYEASHGISLTAEQRQAVLTCAAAHLSLILGGAGTGKTTVLKALYAALEQIQPGIPIYQLALAGRAAQRMAEATGRESMTIAGFLTKVEPGGIELGTVVVVDEVSMVDVILMYRLLRHLPDGVRLILVGDPSQLPPIGPGLVLHALACIDSIPQTELKVVKRQSVTSGIPQVAAAIRNHEAPVWATYAGKPHTGVSFVPCLAKDIEATTQRIYAEVGGTGRDYSVQILSVTNSRVGGVKNLNAAFRAKYQTGADHVFCFDPEHGVVGAGTTDREPIKVGDLVIYTQNDYQLGLRNGSLGRIVRALPVTDADDLCCVAEFEGVEYELNSTQMLAVSHSYAITVHKSQGSQFKRIIVPIRESRLLDQTLIYTAVTRGIDQVVLIGDEQATLAAIRAAASSARRHITLPSLLEEA